MSTKVMDQQSCVTLPEVSNVVHGEGHQQEEAPVHDGTLCGIGSCTPAGAQRCANVVVFTVTCGVASLCLSALYGYILSQITAIEIQFGFSSTDAGFLVSCLEIGYVSTILIFSHFGHNSHIPRLLATTAIIFGIAGILCSLPQLIEPASLPTITHDSKNNSQDGDIYLCRSEGRNLGPDLTCAEDESYDTGSSQWVVYILTISLVVQGICLAPRTPLSTVYVDNNVTDSNKSGLFLGLLTTLSLVGPSVSYVVGGVFSQIPVDLQETVLTPSDPRWIGAWWLGFIVFGAVSMLAALPLFFFPRKIKGSWRETHPERQQKTLVEKIKSLPVSVLRVMRRPVYTLTMFGSTVVVAAFAGYAVFGPKYLETVFHIPAWQANVIQGVETAISAGLGIFLGGWMVTRFRMERRACILFVLVASVMVVLTEALNFIFGCENPPITGLLSVTSIEPNSTADCDCTVAQYLPVCGVSTQTTYFSPCHAGCRTQNETTYGNCTNEAGSDVTVGICDTGCPYLYLHVVTTVMYNFIETMAIMPGYIVLLRSVEDQDKSMAIGILGFNISLIGFLPAPVIYGTVIDTTCRLWDSSCGTQGFCSLHDIVDMRFKVIAMDVGFRSLAVLLFLIAFLIGKTEVKKSDKQDSVSVTIDTVM